VVVRYQAAKICSDTHGAIRIKRDAAPELLARLYGWFTEGLDALDLKEAKSSLNELPA